MNRSEFSIQYQQVNSKLENLFFPKVKAAIHALTAGVIAKVKSEGIEAGKIYASNIVHNEKMTEVITKLYELVGKKHAQTNYSRLLHEPGKKAMTSDIEIKGFGFNAIWTRFILDYLRRHLVEKITFDIAQTTKTALLRTLAVATVSGWGVQETVDHLEDWPFERSQAATIVRTETNRAANVGAKAQAETDPYQQVKEWSSAEDSRVRGSNPKDHASHVGLNGVRIDEGDKFKDPRNGDLLDFPGDPNASAESTVNCRCAAMYTYKRDINGNLIPKRKTTVVLYPGTIPQREAVLI